MKKGIICILVIGFVLLYGKKNLPQEVARKVFLTGVNYGAETVDKDIHWEFEYLEGIFPLYQYANDTMIEPSDIEDKLTYEMILAEQAKDEEVMSEDLKEDTKENVQSVGQTVASKESLLEKMKDFNYLLSHYYTVDSTTTIGADQLNVKDLMSRDMHINHEKKGPKILIFHTHSQETFVDSVPGDSNTSIVGMGKYLAKCLNEKGIETMHHDGVYDLINGKLDRSKAYQMSEAGVKEILNQNPSIEVVIDLHRDGVPENMHLVTEINGKPTGKLMLFNGLSRTKTNGDIAYLKNPYIQDNLSFSFQTQLEAECLYPGLMRRIYLKGYRYSLHMMPKSLLVEAGAQTNTVEEMKNSMELLANILYKVLL